VASDELAAAEECRFAELRALKKGWDGISGGGGHPVCDLPAGHDGDHRDQGSFATLIWAPNVDVLTSQKTGENFDKAAIERAAKAAFKAALNTKTDTDWDRCGPVQIEHWSGVVRAVLASLGGES
jgi:hypothetical protein